MKRESTKQTRTLSEVVGLAMADLSNQASITDVVEAVRDEASAREWAGWCEKNITTAVRNALRAKKGGLPEFYAIRGEYKALTLFSVEDYEMKAREMARLSGANRSKVYDLAAACEEAHGRTFDVERVLREEAA